MPEGEEGGFQYWQPKLPRRVTRAHTASCQPVVSREGSLTVSELLLVGLAQSWEIETWETVQKPKASAARLRKKAKKESKKK